MHIFTDRWLLMIFLAPLVLLLMGRQEADRARFRELWQKPWPGKGLAAGLTTVALAAFCALGGWLFQDPGVSKSGPVLIDDLHSKRWEKSTVRMGKYDFGGAVVYSYSNLVYFLRHYYDVEINTDKTLDKLDLDKYPVVILKTPAFAYSRKEINSVLDYVERGGGLFLIGDHTNLLGMNTFLNLIGSRYGFAFNYDSSNQYSSHYFTEYSSFYPWAHPTVMGLDYFSFLTSCTLRIPPDGEAAMVSLDAFSDKIDYSKPSFFGDIIVMPDDNFGVFALGAAKKVRAGRVNLFCDSTVFSNFCIYLDGHDRYLLNVLNYLGRRNRWAYRVNWLLGGAAAVFLVLSLIGAKRHFPLFLLWAPLVVVLCGGAGALFWGGMNYSNYRVPEPRVEMTRVAFLREHAEFYLPPSLGRPVIPFDVSFDTFFVALQRLGLFPFYTRDTEEALTRAEAVVIINPVEEFSEGEKRDLLEYVEKGGNLLIMDTVFNRRPHLQSLLDVFGIKGARRMREIEFLHEETESFEFEDVNLKLNLVSKRLGKGTVIALADAQFFSRAVIGGVLDAENPLSRKMYDLVYEIFEKRFALKPHMVY